MKGAGFGMKDRAAAGDGGVAFDEGEYENFTGWIVWGKTEGWVKDATFTLTGDPLGFQAIYVPSKGSQRNVLWKSGVWLDGTWGYGEWLGGCWKGGVWKDGWWKNGDFDGGAWLDGTWMGGRWHTGRAVWRDGIWLKGFCLDRAGRWRLTDWNPNKFEKEEHEGEDKF